MSQKLENVKRLYLEGIRDGDASAALDRYIGERYTQHSTGVGHGKQGFLDFFLPFLERNPDRDIRIVRAIEDGPYVFCSAFQSLNGGTAKWVTMDLFYTGADDRILEHWDVISEYVAPTKSGEDMVSGPAGPSLDGQTDANKALVLEFVKQVLTEGHHDRLDQFVSAKLIQHEPRIASGRDGLAEALRDGLVGSYEMLFKLIGEGDLVMTFSRVYRDQGAFAVFDLYRIEDRLIAEQWSLSEPILPRDQWGNNGKF
ncbi:MAG: nuclear transport factor 2 family protein [Pseudomonadota bacterium]